MKRKEKIRFSNVCLFLFSPFLLGIPYLDSVSIFFAQFSHIVRITVCAFLILKLVKQKALNREAVAILITSTFLVLMTIIRGGDILYSILQLIKPLTPYLVLLCIQRSDNKNRYLLTLKYYLLFIILIDLVTVFIFKEGMPTSSFYSFGTWFLGYKTARIPYVLALIIISTVLNLNKNGKLQKRTSILFLITILDTVITRGTGGSIVTLVMSTMIIALFLFNGNRTKILRKLLLDRRVLLVFFAVAYVFMLTQQSSEIVTYVINDTLSKGNTYTYRTNIWIRCVGIIKEHLIVGNGIKSVAQYQQLIGLQLATSAHNYILTLLINGGITYTILHLMILVNPISKKFDSQGRLLATCYIVQLFILGLSSSALVYSPFIYLGNNINKLLEGIKDE